MLICNDDIFFGKDDLQNFLDAYNSNVGCFYYPENVPNLNMFSCFMLTPEVVEKVGYFDESFYPAYFEDNDYAYRMSLAGLLTKVRQVKTGMKHIGSATITAFTPEQLAKHHRNFNKNSEYYTQKWGGQPHHEHYKTPFGR